MIRLFTHIMMLVLCNTALAYAHGERPRAIHLEFSNTAPDTLWILSDTQGIFANLKTGFSWVCEDAVYAGAPTRGVSISGDRGERWVIATAQGGFVSTDRGCTFTRMEGVVGAHDLIGLWSHSGGPDYLTASRTSMAYNDVYLSPDRGHSWRAFGLNIAGAIKAVHWSNSNPERVYIHHRDGIHRTDNLGHTVTRLVVQVGLEIIPNELLMELAVSPVDSDRLLATVSLGDRSRMLRSDDAGDHWADVRLFDSRDLTMIYHTNGQNILVVNAFGAGWRSKDAGDTWEVGAPVPLALGCLRMKPGTEVLHACSDPDVGGPWVAGRSADFGETWTTSLADFEEASHRDDCSADSATAVCCRGLCPGDQMAEMCGQPDFGGLPPECQPGPGHPLPLIDGDVASRDLGLDGGGLTIDDQGIARPADAGLIDSSLFRDTADRRRVSGEPNELRQTSGGCQIGTGFGSVVETFTCLICVIILRRRRSLLCKYI
jgi:hypothetical protein